MTSRAIIIKGGKILLIHRFKKGREYFTVPGGRIEEGETPEQAVVREVKEETNFDVRVDRKLWGPDNPLDNSMHYYFLVTGDFSKEAKLGGPECEKNCDENRYILEWHDLSEIPGLLLFPEPLKRLLTENFTRS